MSLGTKFELKSVLVHEKTVDISRTEKMSESNARIVVITGCSSGIGLATALLFARDPEKRFKVYATMRNLEKREDLVKDGEKLLGATLFLLKLDVSDAASINQFVDEILEKEGRIDVLGTSFILLNLT